MVHVGCHLQPIRLFQAAEKAEVELAVTGADGTPPLNDAAPLLRTSLDGFREEAATMGEEVGNGTTIASTSSTVRAHRQPADDGPSGCSSSSSSSSSASTSSSRWLSCGHINVDDNAPFVFDLRLNSNRLSSAKSKIGMASDQFVYFRILTDYCIIGYCR
jgi:hypothetical protein